MLKLAEKYNNKLLIANTRIVILELIGLAIIIIAAVFLGNKLGELIVAIENHENSIESFDNNNFYELPTTIYDINNKKISEFFIHKREIVPFHKLPKQVINTFIAIEDQNFYKHNGVDIYSIARAALYNTTISLEGVKWTANQGGSTISQQIAKLLFTKREKTLKRKITELWKTLEIEKRYSKNEIIEKYFNQIYFGHGIYGIASASKFFFNKDIEELNITEAALLASIPPAPNNYSPFKNPEQARKRHKRILNKISALGLINKKQAKLQYKELWQQLSNKILNKHYQTALGNRIDKAPYFSEYVRLLLEKKLKNELKDKLSKEIKGQEANISKEKLDKTIDNKIRQLLFTGGFKIYTSLDLNTQQLAQKLIKRRLELQDAIFQQENRKIYSKIQKRYSKLFQFIGTSFLYSPSFNFSKIQKQKRLLKQVDSKAEILELITKTFSLNSVDKVMMRHERILTGEELNMKTEAALIAIEPKTGYIKAMLGGRKFSAKNRLNRVFSKRQPGSAFKSLVYGAALNSKKYNPNSIIEDKPISIQDKDEIWSPQNHNKQFLGPVSMRKALALSINTVAVRIVKRLTPKYIINFSAPLLGMKREDFGENISLALGTSEITPMEMCHAMAVYANGGLDINPIAILRINDRQGNTIKDFSKEHKLKKRKRLITRKVARAITSMLKDVINKGTGRAARKIGGLRVSAAGKTGTSQKSKDVWFAGFTANLASVIWIGFDRDLSLGEKQFGSNVVAPTWGQFMEEARKHQNQQKNKKHKKTYKE